MKNKEKDIVLKGIEKLEKDDQKVFTKNKAKDIMKNNYNPLKVNCKIYKRESGLFIMKTKEVVSNEDMNKLIITKKDFKEIFNNKKEISKSKYEQYLRNKNYT